MAHTPGPWEVVYVGHFPIGVGTRINSAGTQCECFKMIGNVADKTDSDDDLETIEANAHLIAAAADLLGSARFALSVLESSAVDTSERMAMQKLSDAILKAEGGTP